MLFCNTVRRHAVEAVQGGLMKLPMPQFDLLDEHHSGAGDEIRVQVLGLLTALYPRNDLIERRRDSRYPFPCLIHLTPVSRDGHSLDGEKVVVVGKHLSEHGLGFYHPAPLPHRRMIASLEGSRGHWVAFLIDVNWCRFTKDGWYESGGRFLQAVLSPQEKAKTQETPGVTTDDSAGQNPVPAAEVVCCS
jgi:hypothetical protein